MQTIRTHIEHLINTINVAEYGWIKCNDHLAYGAKTGAQRARACWILIQNNGIYADALDEYIIEDLNDPTINWEEAVQNFVIKFLNSNRCSPIGM